VDAQLVHASLHVHPSRESHVQGLLEMSLLRDGPTHRRFVVATFDLWRNESWMGVDHELDSTSLGRCFAFVELTREAWHLHLLNLGQYNTFGQDAETLEENEVTDPCFSNTPPKGETNAKLDGLLSASSALTNVSSSSVTYPPSLSFPKPTI
jgi:hypothetical protein